MSENTHIPAPHIVTVEVGGRTLTLESGKIAKQANGAIVARFGKVGADGPWVFVSLKADTFLGYAKIELTRVTLSAP